MKGCFQKVMTQSLRRLIMPFRGFFILDIVNPDYIHSYRIESCTSGGQILISPETYGKVQSLVHIRKKMEMEFKGINEPVIMCDVVGMGGKYQLSLS